MSSVINALKLQQDIFGDDLFLSNLSELNSEIREVVIPKTEIKENIISDNDMKLKSKKSEIDNYEKFIVSLDDVLMSDRKGIKHIQAWHLDKIL